MTTTRRPRTTKPRAKQESQLLARIRLAIGIRADFLVTRINTGVFSVPGSAVKRKGNDPLTGRPWVNSETGRGRMVRSAPNGFPDLIGTQLRRVLEHYKVEHTFGGYEKDQWHSYGQTVAIETKSNDGELSDEQRLFKQALEEVGGIYVLARSVDDVLEVLGPVPEWVMERRRR